MPTTNDTLGYGGGPQLAQQRYLTFVTTNTTPVVYEYDGQEVGRSAIGGTYMLRIEYTAVGSGSVSAGVIFASYYDNGSTTTLIGVGAGLSAGPATINLGTTGTRTMMITFTGLSSQTLTWSATLYFTRTLPQ